MKKIPAIVILGPTAVGKSATSLELAKLMDVEIVSADSRQVYRYMNIGTAKVSEEERRKVPHHLIDIVNPDEVFNLSIYQKLAREVIEDIWQRKKIPVVVGGTGLYIRSICEGYFLPDIPPDYVFRDELIKKEETYGNGYLYRQLLDVDPQKAKTLHPHDRRRIIRALEVYRSTGVSLSSFESMRECKIPPLHWIKIGLSVDRQLLYRKIESRSEQQIKEGLLEETRWLLNHGYSPELPSMKTLGYAEMIGYIQGNYSWERMIQLLKRNTRRYAKRQIAWFRKEKNVIWLNTENYNKYSDIATKIKEIFSHSIYNEAK